MQWILALLMALMGSPANNVTVTVNYASGITYGYTTNNNQGGEANFYYSALDAGIYEVSVGDLYLILNAGDMTCLPLSLVAQDLHRFAKLDPTEPSNGCFSVEALNR